jgi:hypothetical protein
MEKVKIVWLKEVKLLSLKKLDCLHKENQPVQSEKTRLFSQRKL